MIKCIDCDKLVSCASVVYKTPISNAPSGLVCNRCYKARLERGCEVTRRLVEHQDGLDDLQVWG